MKALNDSLWLQEWAFTLPFTVNWGFLFLFLLYWSCHMSRWWDAGMLNRFSWIPWAFWWGPHRALSLHFRRPWLFQCVLFRRRPCFYHDELLGRTLVRQQKFSSHFPFPLSTASLSLTLGQPSTLTQSSSWFDRSSSMKTAYLPQRKHLDRLKSTLTQEELGPFDHQLCLSWYTASWTELSNICRPTA